MQAIQSLIARALVRVAVAVLPQSQADKLREVTRPIWRPE
jgi:hypothetical protein